MPVPRRPPPIRRIVTAPVAAAALALALAAAVAAGPAAALPPDPQALGGPPSRVTDPRAAIQRRAVRSIERRSVTAPVGADIARERRDLIRDQRGVDFDTQGRILDRQLSRIPPGPRIPTPGAPAPSLDPPGLQSTLPPDAPGLEGTFTPAPGELPGEAAARGIAPGGGSDTVTTASRLIARAQASLDRGEVARARSDADFAGRLLGGIESVPPDHAAFPRLATARERLQLLEGRLSPPADRAR